MSDTQEKMQSFIDIISDGKSKQPLHFDMLTCIERIRSIVVDTRGQSQERLSHNLNRLEELANDLREMCHRQYESSCVRQTLLLKLRKMIDSDKKK